jgi:hypothetical protein
MQHLAGPVFLIGVALCYNAWAISRKKPTISAGIRWVASEGRGPEIVGAATGLLLFHWFLPNSER